MTDPAPHTSLSEIWQRHDTPTLNDPEIDSLPSFYPVYRFADLYSYSPLPLIELKGYLRINPVFLDIHANARARRLPHYPDESTIDSEISRVGHAISGAPTLFSPEQLAVAVADSLSTDLAGAERTHPNHRHVVLCGGKDSLTLLLHRWRTPPLAVSGQPNFPLVQRFVDENEVGCEVLELADGVVEGEIEANCCLNDLQHCRWTGHLQAIANDYGGKVVFWKGQLADVFLTPKWRRYPNYRRNGLSANAALAELQEKPHTRTDADALALRVVRHALWDRGALWQGAHMSMLRRVTGAMFLSGYHGPSMQAVLAKANLPTTSVIDVRDQVGRHLAGRPVLYPSINPGPAPYSQRQGLWHPQHFIAALRKRGIRILD